LLLLLIFFDAAGAGFRPASRAGAFASAYTQGSSGEERGYGDTCQDLLQITGIH
jgi:hypothetical protein